MRSRSFAFVAALSTIGCLSACAQTTRHSNTMIFGTNTQFGIRAGASASTVPEINVGYSRQEAVVMPLVANSRDNGKHQSPCDPSQAVTVDGVAAFAVHPCLLVAVNGKAQDSYSVLASFGAKFDGEARADGTRAKGGLAQYFATGVAAQILALKGGASVVAVGDAATEAAVNDAMSPDTINALYGGQANFIRGVTARNAYSEFRTRLLAKIALTSDADIAAKIAKLESDTATGSRGIAPDCVSSKSCAEAVVANEAYRDVYTGKKDSFDQALSAWKTDQ